jgi:hypothetical protein
MKKTTQNSFEIEQKRLMKEVIKKFKIKPSKIKSNGKT